MRVPRETPGLADLDAGVLDQLDLLGALIAESPHNLVSARDRDLVHEVHIPECIAVSHAIAAGDGRHWLDLGTGGGLPGLVCAILTPRTGWTLVDSTKKKIGAIEEFIAVLGLENARAVAGRAEVLAHEEEHRGMYDGIVSRALARLDVVGELARGFMKPRARLEVIKGPSWEEERGHFGKASGRLRLRLTGTERVGSPERGTVVVSIAAQGGPPRGIPRRNGLPQQMPLGGGRG